MSKLDNSLLQQLQLEGDIYTDQSMRLIYATDASAYRELPQAVIRPRNIGDLRKLIKFAREQEIGLIPRTAGTSLAGQVVGNGIVVDVSKYWTEIIELNVSENWIRVQPGVILDELNQYLEPHGLFFGPETSTSNRCMIGGMVGNNSCGAHSLIYGSTREHTLSVSGLLSDGSEVEFKSLSAEEFQKKCENTETLEGKIYNNLNLILSDKENQKNIREEFPDQSIKRRNTGYAIDLMLETDPFTPGKEQLNLSRFIAGSEGTLAFITEIKLNLVELPPKNKTLVCIHLENVANALKANLIALKHEPVAIELMDKPVMDLTKKNREQNKNRFFVEGDPGAILIVEFAEHKLSEIEKKTVAMEKAMREAGYGFAFPLVTGEDIKKVWELRKAGLGILNNMPGDAKPAPVIEDTAVNPSVLPEYIEEFNQVLKKYDKECVYYAHIATGELHLRPILDLKDPKEVELFHTIALESAKLVKKYKGSLSGEHGDGRLRGEFIPLMIGEKNYELIKQIKQIWDPNNIFNPGKIVDTPKMNTFLRYEPGKKTREIDTVFSFESDQGILRAAEKCNGTAACRKTEIIGGTMCPSYMATRDENSTTRARANILREFLTNSDKKNPFNHKEIYDVMDLCLSCKACKSECPSSVDVAKLKAEFLQHYYDANGIPLRTRAIAYLPKLNKLAAISPGLSNLLFKSKGSSSLLKSILGFAQERSIPLLHKETLSSWFRKNRIPRKNAKGTVYLFNDEFINFNDTDIGIKAIQLLQKLDYEVKIPVHVESGRTFFSKGLIRSGRTLARKNVKLLREIISAETPLIGIEPSAILSFRDEYPEIVGKELEESAKAIAKNTYLIDEFIHNEFEKGNITSDSFTSQKKVIRLHGHCQQKSVASVTPSQRILEIPANYSVSVIASGCCGMAGSFGYEKEHFEISHKVGELVLFPAIRKTSEETLISATGTSCRHQIKDGTGRNAEHPVEILFEALT
jgi:FAD/FMN-containing dehydrogenase/Fe-S oxidoreductase